jgi:hypothetical protein
MDDEEERAKYFFWKERYENIIIDITKNCKGVNDDEINKT